MHLAAPQLDELANLGDSVGLLEGLDFIRRQAAGRPCVLHLSAGKTGGPHRGDTLLERAVDAMLKTPGIVLVQSVGNYAHTAMHAHARVGPDQRHVLDWLTPRNDRTPNELEIWYSGQDVFDVTLIAPDGREFSVAARQPRSSSATARASGAISTIASTSRTAASTTSSFYLYTAAPSGRWRVVLHGREVVDGRLHAWIERDASGRYQSRFPRSQASSRYTTNTICNCFRAIAVGALRRARRPIGRRRASAAAARPPMAGRSRKSPRRATGFARRARCREADGRGERDCA